VTSDGRNENVAVGDGYRKSKASWQNIAQNLVLTALRYTDVGGVTVRWDALPDDPNRWNFSVRDTGPGFRAGPSAPITAALEEATELSESVDTATSQGDAPVSGVHGRTKKASFRHQRAGEGIGLSIVKRLAELLNATVEVESAASEGTTFRIIFPSAYADFG
jgi:signal transduction histidine kinase